MKTLPCIVFEDDDLLVVNKPPGINTHAPAPYANEGIYEFLRHYRLEWGDLAIVHRLDKETSGVMVFSKTRRASVSLTKGFTERRVQKRYFLLTAKALPKPELTVRSHLIRVGEKYVSRPAAAGGPLAETRFFAPDPSQFGEVKLPRESPNGLMVIAEPQTGRTHQIRVHASEQGFPIVGDRLYGGEPAARLYLHAGELSFRHPITAEPLHFCVPAEFDVPPFELMRADFLPDEVTNSFRLIHGASDGCPGLFVDKIGEYLLVQSERPIDTGGRAVLESLQRRFDIQGTYFKLLSRSIRGVDPGKASPTLIWGAAAPPGFLVRENGLKFEVSFQEGYSIGLFLDQRENRRRFLSNHVVDGFPAPLRRRSEVLNTFAYTCAFSVCAASAGARVTSLDLSRKYLDWGKRNFTLNGLNPEEHDFVYGDVFDWVRRFQKKGRVFDVIVLDPPTFSQSKQSGVFQARRDYGKLVHAALAILRPSGTLLASTNAAEFSPEDFLQVIEKAAGECRRKIVRSHYVPQPFDFPISRAEPGYLKTVWLQL